MADSAEQTEDGSTPKAGNAPKDKSCPFCGQAFTSSSLGRHLDLYIKDKNPKPADGVHDVDSIRKMRGGITRRQPRNSIGGRREVSTPATTPKLASAKKRSITTSHAHAEPSPAIPRDGQYAVDSSLGRLPNASRWDANGLGDVPPPSWDGDMLSDMPKRPNMHRSVSKQLAHKNQYDVKQRLADAVDTARAAELALRELLSSWRATKQRIDSDSMPFDFDPLSLDFPALTLQCLKPPPTLFSSTQHPTSTSWSVQCPGQREFGALQAYFREEFRLWKITCAAAATSSMDELTYPPSRKPPYDSREAVRRAEKSAEELENNVGEHLQSAYAVWDPLPAQRKDELWVLELARGVGRKNKEAARMKEEQHRLKQENANLAQQVEDMHRLQQPKEFASQAPAALSFDRDFINRLYGLGGSPGAKVSGSVLEDYHSDLSSVVGRAIDRWKGVVSSQRVANGGLGAQKSLDQIGTPPEPARVNGASRSQSQAPTPQRPQRPPPLQRVSTTSTTGPPSEKTATSTTTGPPSVEETSDQDADADMDDDDSFAMMAVEAARPAPQQPMSQQSSLDVPRTRGHMQPNHNHNHAQQQHQQQQQQQRAADPRFIMTNGAGSPMSRAAMAMSRSMPNMNMAMQANAMNGADMGMAMQGVRSDSMYME